MNIESALSAFGLKVYKQTGCGGEWNLRYLQSHLKGSFKFMVEGGGVQRSSMRYLHLI